MKRTIAAGLGVAGAAALALGLLLAPSDAPVDQAADSVVIASAPAEPTSIETVTDATAPAYTEPVAIFEFPEPEPVPVPEPQRPSSDVAPDRGPTDAEEAGVPSEAWPEVHDEHGNVELEEGESGVSEPEPEPLESDEDLYGMTEDELRDIGWLTPEMDESDLYGIDNQ